MTVTDLQAVATVAYVLGGEITESDDVGAYAVELAVRGWAVLPLRGKVPAIPNPHPRGSLERQTCKGECGLPGHGVLDATSDVRRVIDWWSGPCVGANIGARVPENAFVLDIDPRSGGAESMASMVDTYGELPTTLMVTSGRGDGGTHRYYRAPVGRLTSKHLGAGIDVKSPAGYCVVPPSMHPDGRQPYTWTDAPISDPPAWLVDLIRLPVPEPCWGSERIAHNAQNPGQAAVAFNVCNPWGTRSPCSATATADAFGEVKTWHDVLDPHGWTCLDPDGDGDGARWLHPAATSACSATVRHGCLFVYSTNTPFVVTEASDPHGYTKFRAYAALGHGGDLSAAARALQAQGVR